LKSPAIGRIVTLAGFAIFVFVVIFPVYWIAMSSFTPRSEILSAPPNYFPPSFTLDSYRALVDSLPFGDYLKNSLLFAIGSALLAVFVSFTAAYAFARIEFPFRTAFFAFFMLTATLPQIATVIPLFRLYDQLGLVNTTQGLVLLMGSAQAPFTIWILTSFIRQIPREIEEAARMDGASLIRILVQMVAPLTKPALATLFVINFIITWNELFFPLVFAKSNDAKPLTLGLLELTARASGGEGAGRPWDLMSALSMVMVVPTVILVVLFQRMIVQGLTRGAVK
jgi:ABC-type glycerol-3-phosphate transport system permease component